MPAVHLNVLAGEEFVIRTNRRGLGLALLVTAGVAAAEWMRMVGTLRLRGALAIYLVVIGLGFVLAGRRLIRHTITFLALAGALAAAGVAADAAVPPGPDYYAALSHLTAQLAGFVIVTMLVARTASIDSSDVPSESLGHGAWPAVVFVTALAALVALKASTHGEFDLGLDEITSLLQSRWLREPGFGVAYDPAIIDQAKLPYMYIRDSHLYGMYPPGWPVALALVDGARLLGYAGAILGALSVLLCFDIARQRLGIAAGLACAALLLVQPWFWAQYYGLMSHELTILLALLAAWLVLRASRAERHRNAWLILAGFAAGWLGATRPLTGVAILAGLLLWKWLADDRGLRGFVADSLFMGIGATVPALLLLGYNLATTGDPLRFGYDVVQGKLHALGFGRRGFVHGMQLDFTPAVSLESLSNRAQNAAEQAIGFALLLPVIALALARRVGMRWRMLLPLLILPVANFFFFGNNADRMYVEIIPFVIIGWITLVLRSRALNRAGVAALVAAGFVGSVLVARRQHVFQMAGNVSIAVKSVQERGRHAPLVVLVDTLGAPHGLLWQFFAIGGTPRDVRPLVFYSGRADSVILTRFSSRIPLRVRWTGPDHPPALLELGRISRPSGEN